MKRKKGFTLIELLAVIVILAIIALITVPTVIKIINNTKKGAAEDSTYGAVPSNPQQPVAYYEYGEPTTSSTTDYTTLGKTVFVKLEGEQKSVCIVRNGELSCLKNNNYTEYSSSLLTTGFAGMSCYDRGSGVLCIDGALGCSVDSDGYVYCYDNSPRAFCSVNASGFVDCG